MSHYSLMEDSPQDKVLPERQQSTNLVKQNKHDMDVSIAKATRKVLRERYRRIGKVFLLATCIVLFILTPIFYIICYKEGKEDHDRFSQATCKLTNKSYISKEITNLCQATVNYISQYVLLFHPSSQCLFSVFNSLFFSFIPFSGTKFSLKQTTCNILQKYALLM